MNLANLKLFTFVAFVFLGSAFAEAEAEAEVSILQESQDPERVQQIKNASELFRAEENISASVEKLETITHQHFGLKFPEKLETETKLSKPVYEWVQNNLIEGSNDSDFIGLFPVEDQGTLLGFVVVKKELEKAPVFYLISEDGDLRHLTRRL